MPRIRTGMQLEKVKAATGRYAGPTPVNGVYRVEIVKVSLEKIVGKQDWKYVVRARIAHDEDSDRAKYNGAFLFWREACTEQGQPYLRQFADALGLKPAAMNEPVTDGSPDGNVPKIGGKTVAGLAAKVLVGRRRWKGATQLDVQSWFEDDGEYAELDESGSDDDDADDDYEDEEDEEVDDDEAEDEDYDDDEDSDDDGDDGDEDDDADDDDESDEDDDDEDDAEEDEAPAPARRGRPRKAAPVKAPAKKAPAKAAARTTTARKAPAKKAPAKTTSRRKPW